ncbi:hypothetical protein Q31a_00680 [Aureliella helgolandensis]|uniref:Uncharacterized protein n=1 Tax=Aureliella helgolandensis TaxID=2527968 RepID=A0A518FZK5_9BACT|nr:hypothetical protein Q31a_00680 [Aureliella helgolandensis]
MLSTLWAAGARGLRHLSDRAWLGCRVVLLSLCSVSAVNRKSAFWAIAIKARRTAIGRIAPPAGNHSASTFVSACLPPETQGNLVRNLFQDAHALTSANQCLNAEELGEWAFLPHWRALSRTESQCRAVLRSVAL